MGLLIDGKKISNEIKNELKIEILKLKEKNIKPGLGLILVGDRKDSKTYVKMKKKACDEIGIYNLDIILDSNVSQKKIIECVEELNNNKDIHGILIQLPLPSHINKYEVLQKVRLDKDVDGFHPTNIGNLSLNRLNNLLVPCTPRGCIELLDRYKIEIKKKHVVIIGRSNIVGMPLALLLLHRDATITICHSHTEDVKSITKKADILIVACGKTKMVKKDWINENCIIIDIGINAIDDNTKKSGYRLVGDVDFEDVINKTKAITPVPGGVGPMTIAMLLKHTIDACKKINI